MRMRRTWSLVLFALLAGAAPAAATVGGPTLLDVLGWDPDARRVYVHFIPTDAGTGFGDVVSFAPEAGAKAVSEPWVRQGEGTGEDPALQERLVALRRRLNPMTVEPAATLPWQASVAAPDTVRDFVPGLDLRYRVRARWERGPEFEFVTWGSSVVVLKAIYAIPGRPERLFVFAFVGDRSESGYETQEAVVVGPDEKGLRQLGAAGGR